VYDRGSKLDYRSLLDWLKEASWFAYHNKFKGSKLVKREHVTFICIGPDGKATKVHRKGLKAYFDVHAKQLQVEPVAFNEAFTLNTPNVDIVLGWTSHDEEHIRCYTNSVLNHLGGTHQKAFIKLIDSVFRKYAKASQKYKIQDFMVGAIGCINVRVKAPKFDSQGKSRLASPEVAEYVEQQVRPVMEKWARQNAPAIRELIERACAISALTSQLKDDKKLAAALKTKKNGRMLMPAGMLVSHTKKKEDVELFLVEGLSAKGGTATASNRLFQEVLPLRGKLPNLMRPEKKKNKASEVNQTIVDILKATGITPALGS